ncbi:MAG: hypothetical protein WCH39_16545 [Schlesneria sp.]
MDEFFRGWRWKIGVMTLMLACVLMAGWVRSVVVQDTFVIPIGNKFSVQFVSAYHRLILGRHVTITGEPLRKRQLWTSIPAERKCWQLKIELMTCRVEFDSFLYANNGLVFNTGISSWYFEFPYWIVVAPLTVASALLLLSKPHKPTQTKLIEPTGNEGA